ncbi:MAG TPA: hypothetical protein VM425_19365 [Myxococcota bacterium]|nr:hypothetical protein [Myxococcota bacterium]
MISTPSDDGAVALAHDVDIIIGVGLDIPWMPIPELSGATPPLFYTNCQDPESSTFDASMCYLSPHEPLGFIFNSLMGYVAFDAEPLTGLTFAYTSEKLVEEFTMLWSDSILGLSPGEHYVMDFPEEGPPEGTCIPRTTDRFGRPLKESVHLEFNTSHVRIFLPTHDPAFSATRLPDLWYKLAGYSPEYPWFAVESTPAVRRLSATGPDGTTAGVFFTDISLPAGNEENSFSTIYPSEVPGRPGCPTTIEVHAYGAGDEYLGKDSMQVYAYPPPERIKIVTYNSHTNQPTPNPSPLPEECAGFPSPCLAWCPGSCPGMDFLECWSWCATECPDWCADLYLITWSERLDNFVRDIVVPYKPAIIAVQEVMLDTEGACEFNKGEYLHHLVDKINQELGRSSLDCGKYYLATSLKSNYALWGELFCDRWEGEAIIYDSQQVRFVYPHPRPGAQESYGCKEWYEGQQDLYESLPYGGFYNDCMTRHGLGGDYEDGDNALVSRAVFEFPLHSNRYFSFYNVHHPSNRPCAIPLTISDYVMDRQNTFRDDLASYLLDDARAKKPFSIYPPIFAGDMNNRKSTDITGEEWMDRCNFSETEKTAARNLLALFTDAPSLGTIDKIWLGKPTLWNDEYKTRLLIPPNFSPPENPEMSDEECRMGKYPPFSCYSNGYIVIGNDNIYSDHSPSMVEVEANEE